MKTDLIQCQGCHGDGGEKYVILDDSGGPFEECGYCSGKGRTAKMMNAWIMRWSTNTSWSPLEEDIYLHESIMDLVTQNLSGTL